jgi:predicted GNAT family acetyltransferase
MASLIIAHEPAAKRFVARLAAAGPEIGELLYEHTHDKLDLQHTFVAKDGRGLGVGARLADAACAHAAAQNLRVLASCSYISDKYFAPPPAGWAYDAASKLATRQLQ